MRIFVVLLSLFFTLKAFTQVDIAQKEAAAHQALLDFTPNPMTENYDLVYNRLELEVDPLEHYISGEVTAHFVAEENMSEIVFDLKANMNISSIKQRDNILNYSRDGDYLIIQLPVTQQAGVLDSVSIDYSGSPADGGYGYFAQTYHNGNEILWTLSEPKGAKYWWPTKQDLSDKIDSLDVFITFPKLNSNGHENVAVSNGIEVSQEIQGDFKTTHFKHRYPIPAYLVAIAVSNYSIYTQQVENNGNPFEIVNYLYPESLNSVQDQLDVTVDIMEFFSTTFGEYPYAQEKYGHCQFSWGGGMEHATVSFMGTFSLQLIAHELAHQWFGNKVTCAGWQNIWLNEGFANLLYALVREDFYGEESYRDWRESMVENITAFPDGSVYVPESELDDIDRIFSSRLSYNKGGMVLHMLRRKMGDDDFFQGLRNYLDHPDYAYGFADTENLKQVLQDQSGLDLDEFFEDWIYGEGYPSYHLEWNQNSENQVLIHLQQESSMPDSVGFFDVKVPVRLIGNEDEMEIWLDATYNNQSFLVEPDFVVQEIQIDPNTEIISKNNTSVFGLDAESEISLELYPNPAETNLYIDYTNSNEFETITIFNTSGQLLKSMSFQNEISVEKFSSGLYFLVLEGEHKKITKRIIIK